MARDPTIKEKAPNSHRENQAADEEVEKLDIDDDTFMRFSLTKSNISDYGLSFFFEVIKDLVISKEYIETLYRVIIKIVRTKLRAIHPLPELPQPDAEGNEPSEEEKQQAQKKIDEVTKVNADNEKFNEEVLKFQSKVKINYRPIPEPNSQQECALMRVNNYREQKLEEITEINQSLES